MEMIEIKGSSPELVEREELHILRDRIYVQQEYLSYPFSIQMIMMDKSLFQTQKYLVDAVENKIENLFPRCLIEHHKDFTILVGKQVMISKYCD